MSLSVIGAGLGRTGTLSLKLALERLGLGPCHHMREVFRHPRLLRHWQDAAARRPVAWEEVFAGYHSAVDWPSTHFWRELAAAYPEAKIILTVRPEAAWWASFSRTIPLLLRRRAEVSDPYVRGVLAMATSIVVEQAIGGRPEDEATSLARYRRQIAEVAPERLLVFDVAEGWHRSAAFWGCQCRTSHSRAPTRSRSSGTRAGRGGRRALIRLLGPTSAGKAGSGYYKCSLRTTSQVLADRPSPDLVGRRHDAQSRKSSLTQSGLRAVEAGGAATEAGAEVAARGSRQVMDAAGQTVRQTAASASGAARRYHAAASQLLTAEGGLAGFWLELAREQVAQGAETFGKLAATRDWREALELQGTLVRGSFERMGRLNGRYLETVQAVLTAAGSAAKDRTGQAA